MGLLAKEAVHEVILSLLHEKGEMRIRELAKAVQLPIGRVYRILIEMEKDGVVTIDKSGVMADYVVSVRKKSIQGPLLIILSGIQGSGKSRLAKLLKERLEAVTKSKVVIISSDSIRKELFGGYVGTEESERAVWGTFNLRLIKAIKEDAIVIVDATNRTKTGRNDLRSVAYSVRGRIPSLVVWIRVPLEVALKRNAERPPETRVPDEVVREYYETFTPPDEKEPHVIVDGTRPFEEQLDDVLDAIREVM